MDTEKVSLIDLLLILARGKKFIFFFSLVMSILAVVYSLVVAEQWTSSTTILPIDTTGNINISSSLLEGFGLGSDVAIKSLDLKYASVLKSRSVTEHVIEKFGILDYLKIKQKDPLKAMETALKQFHKTILKITITDDTDFLTISVTTKDRNFSKELTEYYLSILHDYITNNTNNIGKQKRELFESRLTQITSEMNELSEEMKKYQSVHNIIDIENQARASIAAYSKILEELFTVELELSYADKYMPNSLAHRNLLEKKDNITESLKKLESNNKDTPFLLALNNINSGYYTLQEGVFRLEIYQKLLSTIYPQLELARIEELEKMDKYEVIEYPYLPGFRTYPKRAVICVLTILLSLVFSSACVLMKNLVLESDKKKINELWHTITH